ncbi:glucose-6-phosphate dehydrogenase [Paenibacillus sp. P26]|nr:glucose-6-phosphate dehydrogenase [Paenibacillus sp. P26]
MAKRKIFPALYNLYLDHKLPSPISIVGVGLEHFTELEFESKVEQSIQSFSRRKPESAPDMKSFLSSIRYLAQDVSKQEGYTELLDLVKRRERELGIPENRLFYLSVAPEYFDIIALNIEKSGLGSTQGWKRLIVEKPFGHDLKSAQELNEKLSRSFDEDEVYRIDHYLGKPMIQNLEALEFANPILQALWSNKYIANVQITASETVGVEERAGYYDHTGAIRDMFQNHMLQILMLIAMHPPKRITAQNIRSEKQKIIESFCPLSKEEVANNVVRGQYDAGEIQQQAVIGYRQEPGVDASSGTETFFAARIWIDDPCWEGVPFYIRTGKRMKAKSSRIIIEFKNPLRDLYKNQNETPHPNLLTICINPDEGVALQLNAKNPMNNNHLEPIAVNFSSSNQDVPEAYENLIHDALEGDSTYFAHWNEVEAAWRWVQPVLDAFEESLVPLHMYPSGSMGPEAANRSPEEQGYRWW